MTASDFFRSHQASPVCMSNHRGVHPVFTNRSNATNEISRSETESTSSQNTFNISRYQ